MRGPSRPIKLYVAYAREDEELQHQLAKHLSGLRRQGYIENISPYRILPGQALEKAANQQLDSADLILFLLSADFFASDYFYHSEVQRALARDWAGTARVIPILLRPVDYLGSPFAELAPLPTDGKPITKWQNRDEAFFDITESLRHIIESFQDRTPPADTLSETLWSLPYKRNPLFTGRNSLLADLARKLQGERRSALMSPLVLNGLAGIGKTQLALEYSYRWQERYQAIFWLRATSAELLTADLFAIAQRLDIPLNQEQPRIIEAVTQWLRTHQDWLLVLDDVEEYTLIEAFLRTAGNGDILITTQAQTIGSLTRYINITCFSLEEGSTFLLRRARPLPLIASPENISRKQAEHIVQLLDGWPLALDQAGAFLAETKCSLPDYPQIYLQYEAKLLKMQVQHLFDSESVAATCLLALDSLSRDDPRAIELLHLCAFLDSNAIPEDIFTKGAAELGATLSVFASDPLALSKIIDHLLAFSLIRRNSDHTFTIHRIIQEVMLHEMDEETQRLWAERSVRAVNLAFPNFSYDTILQSQLYLHHAQRCAALIDLWHLYIPEAAQLLNHAGSLLLQQEQYLAALSLFERALAISEKVLGPNHPSTMSSLNNLASLYQAQGNYTQALPLYKEALAISEKMLGSSHPETANLLNNLASLYRALGNYEQARPLFKQALAISEKMFGPSHPETANLLNNLALLYQAQGNYAQALPLYERALAIREMTLGQTHPDTANSLNNLATLYYEQGNYEQARPIYERALSIYEDTLGPEHPVTITVRKNYTLLLESVRFEVVQGPASEPASYLVGGSQIEIQVIKGNGMLVDKDDEFAFNAKNCTGIAFEQLAIELLPSAEYLILSPNPLTLLDVQAGQTQKACFRLKMKTPGRIPLNYRVNGEMRDPPFYIHAVKDNPYFYGPPVHTMGFVGRQEELDEIIQAVSKPLKEDILLVGERRTGKTSVLYQIKKQLERPFIPVYIPLNIVEPETEPILKLIRNEIVHTLIEHKLLDPEWREHQYHSEYFQHMLTEILQSARQQLADIKLVLLLDEADYLLRIVRKGWISFIDFLRGTPQIDDRVQNILRATLQSEIGICVRTVVAGTNDLAGYIAQRSSPFYNHFHEVALKPLTLSETRELIVRPASILGYTYASGIIERIITLSGGQPYFCQGLCYEAFNAALRSQKNIIDRKALAKAERKITQELYSKYYLPSFWKRVTAHQRAILATLATGRPLPGVKMQQIKGLLDWQLLIKQEGTYTFSAELFRIWTRMALEGA